MTARHRLDGSGGVSGAGAILRIRRTDRAAVPRSAFPRTDLRPAVHPRSLGHRSERCHVAAARESTGRPSPYARSSRSSECDGGGRVDPPGEDRGVPGVEQLNVVKGGGPVMPPIKAELNEYADISATLAADRGWLPVVVAVVGIGTGGVRIGSERVGELHVVHHRGEDAGLVPGQPIQPVGELLMTETVQPRLVGVNLQRIGQVAVADYRP
jgi:hypothetical protein